MSKKVIARWSREYMKKNGWTPINPAVDIVTNEAYWKYLVRFDDFTGTFSKDGINPNERNINCYPNTNGYFPFEKELFRLSANMSVWSKVISGFIPPDDNCCSEEKENVSICKCASFDLTWIGHNLDCVERKKR